MRCVAMLPQVSLSLHFKLHTQVGFDTDVLEVLLHELHNVTDKIVVVVSTRTHNKRIRKALLWDRLKDQSRFKIFLDKVVHLVLDDNEAFADPQAIFAIEGQQEKHDGSRSCGGMTIRIFWAGQCTGFWGRGRDPVTGKCQPSPSREKLRHLGVRVRSTPACFGTKIGVCIFSRCEAI